MDAKLLKPGSIVHIASPLSSAGKPTYAHNFIVARVPTPLATGAIIKLVGISSRVADADRHPLLYIPLRWLARHGGHPATGLEKPSHACVQFVHILTVGAGADEGFVVDAEFTSKTVSPKELAAILKGIDAREQSN